MEGGRGGERWRRERWRRERWRRERWREEEVEKGEVEEGEVEEGEVGSTADHSPNTSTEPSQVSKYPLF